MSHPQLNSWRLGGEQETEDRSHRWRNKDQGGQGDGGRGGTGPVSPKSPVKVFSQKHTHTGSCQL